MPVNATGWPAGIWAAAAPAWLSFPAGAAAGFAAAGFTVTNAKSYSSARALPAREPAHWEETKKRLAVNEP